MKIQQRIGSGVGAIILGFFIAPLTVLLIIKSIQLIAQLLGNGLSGTPYLVVLLVSSLIGIKVAGEVALIRLTGYDSLQRGNPQRTVFRVSLLFIPIVAALVLIGRFLVTMTQWGLRSEPVVLGLVGIVVLALVWSALRIIQSYRKARGSFS